MQSYQRFQHVGHTAFNTSGTNGPRSLSFTKAGIHSALGERSHTAAHTPKHGRFGWGWYHYPRSVPHVSETLRGRSLKRQTLPLLGLGRGCSRRTQKACGTAMRLCVSLSRRRRGPAGLRDLFRFCRNCGLYTLGSPRKIAHKGLHGETRGVLGGGAITTLGAFRAFRKPCVAGA